MRRSRFTVTFSPDGSNEILKEVALCYTAASARDWYERCGTVLEVTRGDYRRAAARASGGFTVDRTALRDARDLLGLKLPVRVRFNARHGNTRGNYKLHRAGYHDIMLKSYLSPEQASSTLWHELTHALQAERDCGGSREGWLADLETRRGQYKRCPTEIEAREMQALMADVPLCR